MFDGLGLGVLVVLALAIVLLAASVKIVAEYERGVIFRLGRVIAGAKGPGLFFIIPIIDKMVKVNLQTVTMNIPAQDVITRDNVTVRVDAVTYFKVVDPVKATVNIQNYIFGTSQIAQTTLRSVCGTAELDELLAERERLNSEIQHIVDDLTEPWRVKIINAEGEFQAAEKLSEAAAVIAVHPIAYQLRMLQTMTEVAAEKNSTLVLPIPIELLGPFRSAFGGADTPAGGTGTGGTVGTGGGA